MNKLEVNGIGEKRKSTPPDLLALSQMYFERNQVWFYRFDEFQNRISKPLNNSLLSSTVNMQNQLSFVIMMFVVTVGHRGKEKSNRTQALFANPQYLQGGHPTPNT